MATTPAPALVPCTPEMANGRPAPERAAPPAVPPIETLLVNANEAAVACGIGRATWFRLKAAGKTPAPVKLAGRVLYRAEDLRLWVAMGCPDRKTFEAQKGAVAGPPRRPSAGGRDGPALRREQARPTSPGLDHGEDRPADV